MLVLMFGPACRAPLAGCETYAYQMHNLDTSLALNVILVSIISNPTQNRIQDGSNKGHWNAKGGY
jgi:hypothetical protein